MSVDRHGHLVNNCMGGIEREREREEKLLYNSSHLTLLHRVREKERRERKDKREKERQK